MEYRYWNDLLNHINVCCVRNQRIFYTQNLFSSITQKCRIFKVRFIWFILIDFCIAREHFKFHSFV